MHGFIDPYDLDRLTEGSQVVAEIVKNAIKSAIYAGESFGISENDILTHLPEIIEEMTIDRSGMLFLAK